MAQVTRQEEGCHQSLPSEAGRDVSVSTSCQSLIARLFPGQKTPRPRLLLIGRAPPQGCCFFPSPLAPACSSCLFSSREGGPEVLKGWLVWYLLEDSLALPLWISFPSYLRPRSHDYCGRSDGLCSETEGWRENLRERDKRNCIYMRDIIKYILKGPIVCNIHFTNVFQQ